MLTILVATLCCVTLPTKAFAIIQVPTDINAVLMPDGTIVNSEFTLDGSNSEESYLVEANLNLNNGYEGNISFEKPFERDTNKIEVNSKESVNGNLNITKFDKNADYGNRLTIGSIGWKIEPEYNLQFAVFSETDNSLSFYRKDKIPNVGETFNDRVVTEIYQDVNKVRAEESADLLTGGSNYGTPWNSRQSQIEKVFVKDSIAPISTAYWFFMYSLDEIDISKLDTRLTDNMFAMFAGGTKAPGAAIKMSDTLTGKANPGIDLGYKGIEGEKNKASATFTGKAKNLSKDYTSGQKVATIDYTFAVGNTNA